MHVVVKLEKRLKEFASFTTCEKANLTDFAILCTRRFKGKIFWRTFSQMAIFREIEWFDRFLARPQTVGTDVMGLWAE